MNLLVRPRVKMKKNTYNTTKKANITADDRWTISILFSGKYTDAPFAAINNLAADKNT